MSDLDRFDLRLLRTWPEKNWAFAKNEAQDRRASDLARKGYLDRDMRQSSLTGNGSHATLKWTYRLTEKGKAARGEAT